MRETRGPGVSNVNESGTKTTMTTTLLVMAVALSSLATAGSKAVHGHDRMITHQGIIMALHGIIDHLDTVEMQEDRQLAASVIGAHLKTVTVGGLWQVGEPDSPVAAEVSDSGGVKPDPRDDDLPRDVDVGDRRRRAAAVGPDELFTMMDLNRDGRLFLSELGGFMWAVVELHIHEL